MADSTLSFGIFAERAFWSARRRVGLPSGLVPPDLTAMAMSLLTRVNNFAILFQRANIVALRVSKIRPMGRRFLSPLHRQGVERDERRLGVALEPRAQKFRDAPRLCHAATRPEGRVGVE